MSAPYRKFRIMETQQQINTLESRQLELRAIMAELNATAAKCFNTGKLFRKTMHDEKHSRLCHK